MCVRENKRYREEENREFVGSENDSIRWFTLKDFTLIYVLLILLSFNELLNSSRPPFTSDEHRISDTI